MERTKGFSLAKGPVGIIGAVLLAGGILGLLMGSTDFTTSAPDGDVSGGTAQHLSEQPLSTVEVNEPGVPPVHQHPFAGGQVLLPAWLAAAGLVDAEDAGRRRRSEVAIGDLDERGMRRRP